MDDIQSFFLNHVSNDLLEQTLAIDWWSRFRYELNLIYVLLFFIAFMGIYMHFYFRDRENFYSRHFAQQVWIFEDVIFSTTLNIQFSLLQVHNLFIHFLQFMAFVILAWSQTHDFILYVPNSH